MQRVTPSFEVREVRIEDAGQILTLQRAAFVSEAQIYGDPDMPALTQTLEQLEAELADNLGCVATDGDRVVGALRAVQQHDLLLIGRIATAPDRGGEGIASALLDDVEARARALGCAVAELFTGSRSETNVSLYLDRGYVEAERIDQGDGTSQIFLRKNLEPRR